MLLHGFWQEFSEIKAKLTMESEMNITHSRNRVLIMCSVWIGSYLSNLQQHLKIQKEHFFVACNKFIPALVDIVCRDIYYLLSCPHHLFHWFYWVLWSIFRSFQLQFTFTVCTYHCSKFVVQNGGTRILQRNRAVLNIWKYCQQI